VAIADRWDYPGQELLSGTGEPHLNRQIRYLGPVDVPGKNDLFARARGLLHLNTIPERFGLVLAEGNASGVPVIAMNLGSCGELIENGRTGFLVNTVDEAVKALQELASINSATCRERGGRLFEGHRRSRQSHIGSKGETYAHPFSQPE
jgi:glycosyltransferase involved in cell wall biosynthesis